MWLYSIWNMKQYENHNIFANEFSCISKVIHSQLAALYNRWVWYILYGYGLYVCLAIHISVINMLQETIARDVWDRCNQITLWAVIKLWHLKGVKQMLFYLISWLISLVLISWCVLNAAYLFPFQNCSKYFIIYVITKNPSHIHKKDEIVIWY